MIETMKLMQDKDAAITGRHFGNNLINRQPIHNTCLGQIPRAKTATGPFRSGVFHEVVERDSRQGALAKVHKHDVHSHPV